MMPTFATRLLESAEIAALAVVVLVSALLDTPELLDDSAVADGDDA